MTDDRRDELFTLPVEKFTTAREELARELRAAGAKQEAALVGRLRRPTLAAWAVNQAVRSDPDAYRRLRDAGRTLHQALRRAMSGVGDADVGAASRARRQQVRQLTDQAAAQLSGAGHDPSGHLDAIAATFEAASADEGAGEEIGAAQLSRPHAAPSGFGELSPLAVAPAPDEPEEAPQAREPDRRAEQAVALAQQRAEEASAAAHRARVEADAAASRAEDAEARAHEAEAEVERMQRAATQAREEAAEHRRTAERREQRADEVQAVADRRTAELRAAEEQLADGA